MAFFLEIAEPGTIELLLVSIPESLGLLLFGIGLVGAAVLIRKAMEKTDEKATESA